LSGKTHASSRLLSCLAYCGLRVNMRAAPLPDGCRSAGFCCACGTVRCVARLEQGIGAAQANICLACPSRLRPVEVGRLSDFLERVMRGNFTARGYCRTPWDSRLRLSTAPPQVCRILHLCSVHALPTTHFSQNFRCITVTVTPSSPSTSIPLLSLQLHQGTEAGVSGDIGGR